MHWLMLGVLLAANTSQAIIVRSVANMYRQPSDDSAVISQAICGTTVEILEERPGWLRIRTADQYAGWLPAADARHLAAGDKPYASSGAVAQVESLAAHIYQDKDVSLHRPLLTVPFETRLEILGETESNERWLRTHLPDDRLGWVQRGDVTLDVKPISVDAVITLSRRFLGLPYTWGGASSFGYDCSGFTQMLCRRRGILMPRDASVQAAWEGVVAVERDSLLPGDLLFFGKNAKHIDHTGMYIGGGQFISATAWIHPMIQISDLGDPHWSHLLVACRRLK
jgi:cell wall-associated NlpC family hydrolase